MNGRVLRQMPIKKTIAGNFLLALILGFIFAAAVQSASASTDNKEGSSREGFVIQEISDELFERMKSGNTYKEDCIVPRENLRYLLMLHKDKEGRTHQGEMVVHELIAEDVLEIFEKLYDAGYPIERMVLPDNYMADDETMMAKVLKYVKKLAAKKQAMDETEYLMSSPAMAEIIRQGQEDIKNGRGEEVKVEDLWK